jgi:type II secretory pathway component PulK
MASRRSFPQRSSRRTSRRGIVLLLYIILSAHYIFLVRDYAPIVSTGRDETIGFWSARGGIYRARAQLKLDIQDKYDSLNEDWARPVVYGAGDAPDGLQPKVMVTDEESKFNVAMLAYTKFSKQDAQAVLDFFDRLMAVLDRTDKRLADGFKSRDLDYSRPEADRDDSRAGQIADSIKDYLLKRDSDDSDQATFDSDWKGSKSLKKQSPYPLLTIRELLFAEKMTPRILFGDRVSEETGSNSRRPEDDRNNRDTRWNSDDNHYDPLTGKALNEQDLKNQQADADRVADADSRSFSVNRLPLADYLTLWGDGKININTCTREVLLAMSEHLTWDMVDQIIRARDEAYDREAHVRDGTVADPNDAQPDTTGTTGTTTGSTTAVTQDKRSFVAADIASANAFYTRVTNNLKDPNDTGSTTGGSTTGGNTAGAATTAPKEWQDAFKDMRLFLTVRSKYFRVRASCQVQNITKTLEAVFRRDAGTTATTTTGNTTGGNTTGGNTTGGNTTGGNTTGGNTTGGNTTAAAGTGEPDEKGIPPEPKAVLSLIYLNEVK